jgi:hypothetical protein
VPEDGLQQLVVHLECLSTNASAAPRPVCLQELLFAPEVSADCIEPVLHLRVSVYKSSVLHLEVSVFKNMSKTTKLILLDSLLQEVVATLLHLVFQKPSTAKMESSSHYSWDGEYTA